MSQQSIADKAQIIRTETQKYGNTRQRVADVLDDINETKANKGDVETSIQVEANARAAADTALQNSINAEATARQNADNTLQGNINVEANARAAADTALQNSINAEATARQNADTAEANARAAADTALQNSINAEATARQNADTAEANARAAADALKVDKTTTTISAPDSVFKYAYIFDDSNNVRRMLAGDLGKNIANSSLTSIIGAGMTQGANYTWNAANFYFNLTGIPDVSADSSYTSMLVRNSSGRLAYSDGRIPMLKASELFTDAQIDTWRANMQKSTETYSTGQPRIDTILPPVVNSSNDYIQYVTLVGLNLFINNSNPSTAMVKLKRYKDINSNAVPETVIDITNYQVYQQNASILSFGINYSTLQTGYYKVEVTHNGIVNIGTSDLLVSNTVNNNNNIVLNSWETYTPFEPSNLIITPTSIKKTYSSVIRGSTVIEQQVKHFIINTSDVLSGFRLRFTYKLSPAGNELVNVKHRQSISFGLGYSKDVNTTIVPEILISFIRGTLNIGNASQPSLFVPYIYDIDIVVKNGLATVVINLTNTGTIYTATFSFEQKNEQMFFYSTFLGSNPDNAGQIAGTTQELLFPTTYQSF